MNPARMPLRWRRGLAFLLLLGILSLGTLGACTGGQNGSASRGADSPLSETERSKIDPDLLRLMGDSAKVMDVPIRRRPDGTRTYAVWIRSSDRKALEAAGVPTDSVHEGRVWAWLSLKAVREVARLPSVTAIRADNDPVPRKGQE